MAAAGETPVRNLVVFLADDVGIGDLGAWGSPNIQTPALNRLSEMGAKLTQFHTQPLCSPSRASLLTGQLPVRSGVYTNTSYPLDDIYRVFLPISTGCMKPDVTIPSWLANVSSGAYYSALVGKWHLGGNKAAGCAPTQPAAAFDYYLGLLTSHEEGFPGPFPENVAFPPMSLHDKLDIIEQPVNLETLTPRYTTRALQILDHVATGNTSRPDPVGVPKLQPAPRMGQSFALFVHFEESHIPLFASPGYQHTAARGPYGDMTSQLDGSMAIILDQLEAYGLLNETMIVFTSDNGAWIDPSSGVPGAKGNASDGGSNGPLRGGKGSTWQGGMVNPAIVASPGHIPAGQTVSTPTTIMDILPTFADAANLPLPREVTLDGRSFWAHVNGTFPESPLSISDVAKQARARFYGSPSPDNEQPDARPPPPIHDAIFYWRANQVFAVRTSNYKAHFITQPGFGTAPPVRHDPPLLFDLTYDYGERNPLNTTIEPFKSIASSLKQLALAHNATVTRAPSQLEDVSYDVAPCCGKPYNQTEALQFLQRGFPGLALWDECVCNPENAFRPGS